MCARLKFRAWQELKRPGEKIVVAGPKGIGQARWGGFIRSDGNKKNYWREKGWKHLVDIPAISFAEKSRETGDLVFSSMPAGKVIKGVGNRRNGVVHILTRAATKEERERFGHNRMPVMGEPAFGPRQLKLGEKGTSK